MTRSDHARQVPAEPDRPTPEALVRPQPRSQPRSPLRTGRRRALGAGLGLLLLASSLALAPAALADGTDEGADEGSSGGAPFGERIEPGTSFADTTEVTTGTYTMNVPAPGADHFFEVQRTDPDEVIWYGVTAQLEEGYEYATLSVEGTAEGDSTARCNSGLITNLDGLSFLTSLSSSNRSVECRDAESITISVANTEIADEVLPEDAYYQLVIWTEPPVESTERQPGPNENSSWTQLTAAEGEPEEVPGSRTFTEAEPLADGTYRTTVAKGSPAIFAFPLTFGQHAQVEARISAGADEDLFEDLDATWVSPLGGPLRRVAASGGPGSALGLDGEEPAGWSTPIVTYQNRQRTGGVGSLRGNQSEPAAPAAFAGTYYLVLELPGGEIQGDNYPDEIEIEMNAATITDYEGSPPDYTEEPSPLSALDGSGFVATAEEERAAREQQAEPAPWPLVAGLFGGAALLAAVGGIAVGRVLRRSS